MISIKNRIVPSFNDIISEINSSSTDRGVAVLGAALLEDILIDLMKNILVKHKDLEGFIRTGNAKLVRTFAFSTGKIPRDLFNDIVKISDIRNDFAHHIHIREFNEPNMVIVIRDLKALSQPIQIGVGVPAADGTPARSIRDLSVRMQFCFAVATISVALEGIRASVTPFSTSSWTYPG